MRNASKNAHWPQGFVVYDEQSLMARRLVIELFTSSLYHALIDMNRAIRFFQVETPVTMRREALKEHRRIGFDLIEANSRERTDYLRPETTYGSYAAFDVMYPMLNQKKKACPLVVWQYGKAFRDEQNRPFNELRYREFYQLEYQLIHSPDTKADYFKACVTETLMAALRLIRPDRWNLEENAVPVSDDDLAHYSEKTTDIMIGGHEVAAVSLRTDLEDFKVVEISIGLDRMTYLQQIYPLV